RLSPGSGLKPPRADDSPQGSTLGGGTRCRQQFTNSNKLFGRTHERRSAATTTTTATDSDRYQGVQSEADRGVPGQSRAAQRSDGRTHADAADHDGREVW